MRENPKIYNGQVWQQDDFPYFRIVVIMLVHIENELRFCKASWEADRPLLVMTEENGQWIYGADELFDQLTERKYTPQGYAECGGVIKEPTHDEE